MATVIRITPGLLFLLLFIATSVPSPAQWPTSAGTDLIVCPNPGTQSNGKGVPDGKGGAFIVWQDARTPGPGIYIQHISQEGYPLWNPTGVPLDTGAQRSTPTIIADGEGGVFVAWCTYDATTSQNISAARVSPLGTILWKRSICIATGTQRYPQIIDDGRGGAIIVWHDTRGLTRVFAQRIDRAGLPLWAPNGVVSDSVAYNTMNFWCAGDGRGGVIILALADNGPGGTEMPFSFITAEGTQALLGRLRNPSLGTRSGTAEGVSMTGDGSGGVVVVWDDVVGMTSSKTVWAEHMDRTGTFLWYVVDPRVGGTHLSVCPQSANYQTPSVLWDEKGFAYVSWADLDQHGLYAQKIDTSGALLWGTSGLALGTRTYPSAQSPIIRDPEAGLFFLYPDRGYLARRMDPRGFPLWDTRLETMVSTQITRHSDIFSDGLGGVILLGPTVSGVAAKRILATGGLGALNPDITTIKDIPNDQGLSVRVRWTRSPYDAEGTGYPITMYGIWRKIQPGFASSAAQTRVVDQPGGSPFTGMSILVGDSLGLKYDFLGSVPAVQAASYSAVCETFADSGSGGTNRMTFIVSAHTGTPGVFFLSTADSGYSIDNLAPPSPVNLTASWGSNSVALTWRGSTGRDISGYELFRSTSPGIQPDATPLLVTVRDTTYRDTTAAGSVQYYYVVRAVDLSGNRSDPSNEATVVTTGIGEAADVPTSYALSQNYPNPFNPATVVPYQLPSAGDVRLAVYDMLGREVAVLVNERRGPGRYEAVFSAAHLASGVYLYRLTAGGFVQTRRMALIR